MGRPYRQTRISFSFIVLQAFHMSTTKARLKKNKRCSLVLSATMLAFTILYFGWRLGRSMFDIKYNQCE